MSDSVNKVISNSFTAPSGKKFKEWNTKADGTGTSYTTSSTVTSDVTLYAIWYTPTYVYGAYEVGSFRNDEWVLTDISQALTTAPTDKVVYTKYEVIDGALSTIAPEVCVYSNKYGGELCLKDSEHEVSINKMKAYFGWNDSTNSSTYQGATCTTYSNGVVCADSTIEARAVSNIVQVKNISTGIYCNDNYTGIYCDK